MIRIFKPAPKSDFMRAASLGLEIAVAVFLGAFLGYQADQSFKTAPWGMVSGLVIGSIAGFWNAYKFAMNEDEHS
jgi:F0F1-type ATP synthase assembly protein I